MLRRSVLALGLSAVAVLAAGGPAAADSAPLKYVSAYDARCLEADLAHIGTNGDAVQLWDCYADPGNQVWRIRWVNPGAGTFRLVNAASGKCLESDLAHSGNGTAVQLWDCWNDPGNQQWRSVTVPATITHPIAAQKLVNVRTGQCLDADLAHIGANGARLQLWDCWNDPGNEQWHPQTQG